MDFFYKIWFEKKNGIIFIKIYRKKIKVVEVGWWVIEWKMKWDWHPNNL